MSSVSVLVGVFAVLIVVNLVRAIRTW